MKRLSLLGSTGSIGKNTLNIVRHLKDEFQVVALAAKSNIDLLEEQAHEFHPAIIAVFEKNLALELQKRLPLIRVVGGLEGLKEAACFPTADMTVSAMTGVIGLAPTYAAILAKKQIALANKEVLVSGGRWIMDLVKKQGVDLIPIDSEHSAIFQCLKGEKSERIHKIHLTSSGGPFRKMEEHQLAAVTVEEALNHPTWKMGPKVTIDSSTLMNKGLEVIEARWLFDVPFEKISVVIHPQSIIHSIVEFEDNSMLAQMGDPNMITPIQYALTYPERRQGLLQPFDFIRNGKLEFFLPDLNRFRCLKLAFEAGSSGESAPCYMNAANEVLVNRFLQKEIGWQEIGTKLDRLMQQHTLTKISSFDAILAVEAEAQSEALGV